MGEREEVGQRGPARRTAASARDVARAAGVHPSTVSRSLDPEQHHRVSAGTRRRVQEIADRLGYRPNYAAGFLRRQRSMTIGVLTPSFSNPVYGELMHGIGAELDLAGYLALILEVPDGVQRLPAALSTLRERRVDGIICSSARASDSAALREAALDGVPLVLALRWISGTGLPAVLNADAFGGSLAAGHLLRLGHRRVLQLPGPYDIETFVERSTGFVEAVRSAAGSVVEHDGAPRTPTRDEGRRVMGRLLLNGVMDGVTAVFAHNDPLAIGVLDALADVGLRCPEDVSVVGFNDNALTDRLDPPLSTIRMPIGEMGRLAARRILREVGSAAVEGPAVASEVVRLTPELVVRASTGPPGLTPAGRTRA